MEEKTVKILFVGNASDLASEISLELHRFFESKKVQMEIEHIFTGWEVFKKIEEGISDFDIVVFDKKLKMVDDVFLKIFPSKGHSFTIFFFDSSRNREKEKQEFVEEYFNVIKKRFFMKEDL